MPEERWGQYAPTLGDITATVSHIHFHPDHIEFASSNRYRRVYYVVRMPNRAGFGYLNGFFSLGADIDVSVQVEPARSERQIRQLTEAITNLEAQIAMDVKMDKTENVRKNQRRREELDALRLALQTGEEKMYYMTLLVTVTAETKAHLERACARLQTEGPGRGFVVMEAAYEQQEGLLSVAPLALPTLRYPMLVFGSYLANAFPFTSSQFSHRKGALVGFDLVSQSPMFYDAWHADLKNANVFLSGVSGAGKSYQLKCLLAHSVLHDIRTVVIDWEGEYGALAKHLGGVVVPIDYTAMERLNPCELHEEEVLESGQKKTKVEILEKIEEMTGFIKYAASLTGADPLRGEEIALVDRLWKDLYTQDFGFTSEASSLYEASPSLRAGTTLQLRRRRKQPQLGDFYRKLKAVAEQDPRFVSLADRLERVTAGNTLGLFDCQSTLELAKAPIIVFDLSALPENSDLRKLGQYVALEWTMEQFVKKQPEQKKRVVVDEAQEAMRNMDGSAAGEYAAYFLDLCFTRIRKRGGSAVAASQQFHVFASSAYGQSIIRNSDTKILMAQSKQDEAMLQTVFGLGSHELERLMFEFEQGHARWDVGGEVVYSKYEATPFEHALWNTKKVMSEHKGMA
ncbi:VirB4 family type IV secretion system protein [Alicyclobacillus sp. SP_1]|uniref:VirB4 family type IV secretion system protein n=1 Tax=Alicyclobacillus sp. SP_1 TaxID=2942475 RepID=UPI002157AFAC|nr:DUF87 domain-containing protein [Alicyclobacillus sp. SP_1]